jgi:hypothetical protein
MFHYLHSFIKTRLESRINPSLLLKFFGDAQHNDAQHNDAQHNDAQHNDAQHNDSQDEETQE